MADMLAPVFAVIGILSALEQRHRTRQGQHVDVSMLGALTSFVAIENWAAMRAVDMPARTGLTVQRLAPFGVFQCEDGYIAIVAVHQKLATALFHAMDQPWLIDDPRFATRDGRVANATELEAIITAWSRTVPVVEAVARLKVKGVPVAEVRHPEEALVDPRVVAREETDAVFHPFYPEGGELRTAGVPIRFSAARTGFDAVIPVRIGEQNGDVYGDLLGYDADTLASLAADGVIA